MVEILSPALRSLGVVEPSTAKYDLDEKKDVYGRSGVQEYWIVDPSDKSVRGFFLNKDGSYSEPEKTKGRIQSRLLDAEFRF